ncbi:hypothetical protein [Niveibacterium sp. SC-1]|uniref:hypothetical protein n=1 Tax=Niveibacterium sp. SC-1 TaxID=3135646 RepID=UPI00311E29C4
MRTRTFALLLALTLGGCGGGGSGQKSDAGTAPRGTQTGASVINLAPGTREIAVIDNPYSSHSLSLWLSTSLVDDGRAMVGFGLQDLTDSSGTTRQMLAVRSQNGMWNPLEQRTAAEALDLARDPCVSSDGWVAQGEDHPPLAVTAGLLGRLTTDDPRCPAWSNRGVAQFGAVQHVELSNDLRLTVSETDSAGGTRSFDAFQIPVPAAWALDSNGYASLTHASKGTGAYLWSEHRTEPDAVPVRRMRAALLDYPMISGTVSPSIVEIGLLNASTFPCARIASASSSRRHMADAEAFTNGGRTLLLWGQREPASPTCAIYAAVLDSSSHAVLTPATAISTPGQFASTAWGSVGSNGEILVGWLENMDSSGNWSGMGYFHTRSMPSASTTWDSAVKTVGGTDSNPPVYYSNMIAAGDNGTIAAVRQRQIELKEEGREIGDMDYYLQRFVPEAGWSDETLIATGVATNTRGTPSPGWLFVVPSVDSHGKVTVGYATPRACGDSTCSPDSRFHLFALDLD